jgi:hypothetical protein
MLKLQCKTTFNFSFVGNNFIKFEQELTLETCFEKMWFFKKKIQYTYRDVQKVFGHCNVLLCISYKTTFFQNMFPKLILVQI